MSILAGLADGFRLGDIDFSFEKNFFGSKNIGFEVFDCRDEAEVIRNLSECDIQLLVAAPYTRTVIEKMPKLKALIRYGIGVDTIDVACATEFGIMVCNEPAYCVEDVATHAFALIFDLFRKLSFFDKEIRKGVWGFANGYAAKRIQGRRVGLVGCGNIGKRLLEMLRPFEVDAVIYDPYLGEAAIASINANLNMSAKKVSLEELLKTSDIVSIHCPLNNSTRHLISRPQFTMMKSTAMLVNTSRGAIVDNAALVQAIEEGMICAAGLDVMEQEPLPTDHPFCRLDQVVLTPHAAHYTEEAFTALRRSVAEMAVAVAEGKTPKFLYNRAQLGQ
jgi:D-3-phosphoglycerate dehydrogenase